MCSKTEVVSSIHLIFKKNITYTIESIKESVEQVGGRNLFRFINLVINLVESHGLRVDKRITGVVSKEQRSN